jgi:tRNA A37 threonylcarbamoyladenosine dehydratase
MEASSQALEKTKKFPFLEGPEWENYKLHRRFDRIGRLYGDAKMKKLMDAHVMVIGLGGVGSYAAEMIVRSGIGKMTIVDFDEVCVTNVNRQLHAMQGMVGKQKALALEERFKKINPKAEIVPITKFYNYESSEELLAMKPDYIIDAIDSVTSKAHLLNACIERGIKVVCCSGSAGKMDPTLIRIADLSETRIDPLARMMRKILRGKYEFPRKGKMGIPTVYSTEAITGPFDLHYDGGQGFRCVCPQGDNPYFQCENRNVIHGSAGFVTGSFGFAASSVVVRDITNHEFWPVEEEA